MSFKPYTAMTMTKSAHKKPLLRRKWFIFLLLILTSIAALSGYSFWVLKNSSAILNGQITVPHLSHSVTVNRDGLGIPEIKAQGRTDLAFALGFVHAQERFFQMDLLRRTAAGELSEIFGEMAVDYDKDIRIHRFRFRATQLLAQLTPAEKQLIDIYVKGVNFGLSQLKSKPFEYHLLTTEPKPWQAQDTLLAVFAMYISLQSGLDDLDIGRGIIYNNVPHELADFLLPKGTRWDAAVDNSHFPVVAIPNDKLMASVFATAATNPNQQWANSSAPVANPLNIPLAPHEIPGSNNWAVGGSVSASGNAIVAGDMHLGLRVPNTWFRASMFYKDNESERKLHGVTLPGAPLLVAGTNTNIAWAYTNSQGDWGDVIKLKTGADSIDNYVTANGERKLKTIIEEIKVKDGEDETLEIKESIWGPIVHSDPSGYYAFRWVAHTEQAINLGLISMEKATSVDEALSIAKATRIPAQNFVVGDQEGNIGWTIIGAIPNRVGFDGFIPADWSDGETGWQGFLTPEQYPEVKNPADGVLWSANARMISGENLEAVGFGRYALGARAKQIRDNLKAMTHATEQYLLATQLDDRALFLQHWREQLLKVLESNSFSVNTAKYKQLVESWSGHAAVDDPGYFLVRSYRKKVASLVLDPLYKLALANQEYSFGRLTRQYEQPLWQLIQSRPAHMLPIGFDSWDDLFIKAIASEIKDLTKDGKSLEHHKWGVHNTAQIKHPISSAVPILGYFLDMPSSPLPGDSDMPRVQGKSFGASQRMVIAPGREADALFHMPTSQSGNPLSPYYGAGHKAWEEGEKTPLLPGKTVFTLTLTPN